MPKFKPKTIILLTKITVAIIFPINTTLLFSEPRNCDSKIDAIIVGTTTRLIIWIASTASIYLGKNTSITIGPRNIPSNDTGIEIIDSQLEDIGYISTLQLIGSGTTATANAQLNVANKGYIREIVLNDDGSGYSSAPNVAISTAPFGAGNVNATAVAITTQRAGIFSIDRIFFSWYRYFYRL